MIQNNNKPYKRKITLKGIVLPKTLFDCPKAKDTKGRYCITSDIVQDDVRIVTTPVHIIAKL